MQLHKLLIHKLLAALFAPISCNLEEKRKITSLGLETMTLHTKPSRFTEWAIWNDQNICEKRCTKSHLTLQLLGAAKKMHFYFATNYLYRLPPKVAENKSCKYCNYQLHYSCTLVAKICSVVNKFHTAVQNHKIIQFNSGLLLMYQNISLRCTKVF